MTALHAQGLRKSFRGRRVVDDVSFSVAPGEVVGLLGPNGAGKTTSFHCVVGLLNPDGGEVRLGDRDLSGLPLHQRARLGIGYLPQEPSIFRKLTVRQNFLLVLEGSKLPKNAQLERAEIARSLLADPRFMLFDEPFAGVDPIAVRDLQMLIHRLRDKGLGVLITDHAVRETLGICDRAVLLVEGKLLESGTPAEIAASERARAVYLGERFKLE